MSNKKQRTDLKQRFLKTYFFDGVDTYDFKEVGEFVLVHQWNNNTNRWEVAIWDRDIFFKTKALFKDITIES